MKIDFDLALLLAVSAVRRRSDVAGYRRTSPDRDGEGAAQRPTPTAVPPRIARFHDRVLASAHAIAR